MSSSPDHHPYRVGRDRVVAMSLTPGQERELEALAAALTTTDPQLARDLTESRPSVWSPMRAQLLALLALIGWTAVGLAPFAVGLRLDLAWLTSLRAVTTCVLPYAGLWATFRLFPRFLSRLRSAG